MLKFLQKKKKTIPGLRIGDILKTDMHSHLIPGIDDGAPDMDTSLNLIKGLMELGFTKLITTPHIMSDFYLNTSSIINDGLKNLQEQVKKEGLKVEIQAAAEYYVDEYFEERLEKEALLTLNGKLVLIEQSFTEEYPRMRDVTFKMQLKGYKPVIAHAERYPFYANDKAKFETLRSAGCILQVNLLSLQGYYGKMERNAANYLIQNDLAELLGTDCHHDRHLKRLSNFFEECEIDIDGVAWKNPNL